MLLFCWNCQTAFDSSQSFHRRLHKFSWWNWFQVLRPTSGRRSIHWNWLQILTRILAYYFPNSHSFYHRQLITSLDNFSCHLQETRRCLGVSLGFRGRKFLWNSIPSSLNLETTRWKFSNLRKLSTSSLCSYRVVVQNQKFSQQALQWVKKKTNLLTIKTTHEGAQISAVIHAHVKHSRGGCSTVLQKCQRNFARPQSTHWKEFARTRHAPQSYANWTSTLFFPFFSPNICESFSKYQKKMCVYIHPHIEALYSKRLTYEFQSRAKWGKCLNMRKSFPLIYKETFRLFAMTPMAKKIREMMFVRIWFEPLQQKPDKRKINFIPLVCCVSSYMAEQADAVFVDVVVGCCKYAEVNIYQWRGRKLRMRQHEPTQNEDISLLVTHFQHDNKFSMGNQMKFSLLGAIYELGEYIYIYSSLLLLS